MMTFLSFKPVAKRLLSVTVLSAVAFLSVVSAAPVEASSKLCGLTSVNNYAASLAKKVRVPAPMVVEDPTTTHGAYFSPGTSTIAIRPGCTTKTTIAHEFGHYVIDLAAGMSWSEHQSIAKNFTGYRNWLKTSADEAGFERAAHCVGYQFVRNGTYTKCPHREARDLAKFVIAMAASKYPA